MRHAEELVDVPQGSRAVDSTPLDGVRIAVDDVSMSSSRTPLRMASRRRRLVRNRES